MSSGQVDYHMGILGAVSLLLLIVHCKCQQAPLYLNATSSLCICNPGSKKLFAKFLMKRWYDAHEELKIPVNGNSLRDSMSKKLLKDTSFTLHAFFSYNPGAVVYLTNESVAVPYVRIWKCANEGIGANLYLSTLFRPENRTRVAAQSRSKGPVIFIKLNNIGRLTTTSQSDLSTTLRALALNNIARDVNRPVFAFVRDPFARFLSAFSEVMFRTYIRFAPHTNVLNQSMTMQHIKELVNDENTKMVEPEHMYSMAGPLFEYDIGIIGRLESFTADWKSRIMPTYGIRRPYDENYGQHATSMYHPLAKHQKKETQRVSMNSDPFDARKLLDGVLRSHPEYMRAICHLLLVDYVCLPEYPLPKPCGFLQGTREAATRSVRRGHVLLPF